MTDQRSHPEVLFTQQSSSGLWLQLTWQYHIVLEQLFTRSSYDFINHTREFPFITMTSPERHGVSSSHRQRDSLSTSFFGLPVNKQNIKAAPHHWPFVRGIHRWPVDSHHQRPVIRFGLAVIELEKVRNLSAPDCLLWALIPHNMGNSR